MKFILLKTWKLFSKTVFFFGFAFWKICFFDMPKFVFYAVKAMKRGDFLDNDYTFVIAYLFFAICIVAGLIGIFTELFPLSVVLLLFGSSAWFAVDELVFSKLIGEEIEE